MILYFAAVLIQWSQYELAMKVLDETGLNLCNDRLTHANSLRYIAYSIMKENDDSLYSAAGYCSRAIEKFTQVKSIQGCAISLLIQLIVEIKLHNAQSDIEEDLLDDDDFKDHKNSRLTTILSQFKYRMNQLLSIDNSQRIKDVLEIVKKNENNLYETNLAEDSKIRKFLLKPIVDTGDEQYTEFPIKKESVKNRMQLVLEHRHSNKDSAMPLILDLELNEDNQAIISTHESEEVKLNASPESSTGSIKMQSIMSIIGKALAQKAATIQKEKPNDEESNEITKKWCWHSNWDYKTSCDSSGKDNIWNWDTEWFN